MDQLTLSRIILLKYLKNETLSTTSIFDTIDFLEEKLQLPKSEILDILTHQRNTI